MLDMIKPTFDLRPVANSSYILGPSEHHINKSNYVPEELTDLIMLSLYTVVITIYIQWSQNI